MKEVIKNILNKISQLSYVNKLIILFADTMLSTFSSVATIALVAVVIPIPISLKSAVLPIISSVIVISIFSFGILGVHKIIIRHSQIMSVMKIIFAILIKEIGLFILGMSSGFISSIDMVWHFILILLLDLLMSVFMMTSFRATLVYIYSLLRKTNTDFVKKPVVVYGTTGSSPSTMSLIMSSYSDKYKPLGFVTTLRVMRNLNLMDMPAFYFDIDDTKAIETFFDNHQNPTIVFPSDVISHSSPKKLIEYCVKNNQQMMIAPTLENFNGDGSNIAAIREIEIEDLLTRESISINIEEVGDMLSGKTVLITGAAGSIGSEIVRQVIKFSNVKVVALDNAETPLHNLIVELSHKKNIDISFELGDIRSTSRMNGIVEKYHPNIIYHAAAYKHVPLMESNPCESINVNVLGTKKLADIAVKNGVEKFIMVSTDKVVNPTSIMGSSKRLAEMYVQSLNSAIVKGEIEGKTKFLTTRFGNVLGSNGSVIPLFKSQIQRGGPITVTHPDIIRYFMTIPEACRLVLQAGAIGDGGEIFVFDMGEQVKIVDLAKRMIQLAGLAPDKDIKIEFTGLRQGEKLYEELLSDKENTFQTSHKKIRAAKVREESFSDIYPKIETIIDMARENRVKDVIVMISKMIPEYKGYSGSID